MRYLIVGFGNIGHKRASVLGKKVVATVDPNLTQKADFKDSKKVPLDIFDAAVLTVPQQEKYALVEYFLSQGKHILVEKPLIITPKQFEHLKALVKKNKVIWFTSFNHRFEPNIVRLGRFLKQGLIGKLYFAKFVYSFGNIKERLGTWRETQFGVLEEIAPHLIDFAISFFGYKGKDFESLIARRVESRIFDHWLFATKDKKITFETSSITWKYQFNLDIYGELGSLHIEGLRKWGGSKLTYRKRILPSGAPIEKIYTDSGPDITWKKDLEYFEKLVNISNYNATRYKMRRDVIASDYKSPDLEMSKALANIALTSSFSNNQQTKLYEEILK